MSWIYDYTNTSIYRFFQDLGKKCNKWIDDLNKFDPDVIEFGYIKKDKVPLLSMPNQSIQHKHWRPSYYDEMGDTGLKRGFDHWSPFEDPKMLFAREVLEKFEMFCYCTSPYKRNDLIPPEDWEYTITISIEESTPSWNDIVEEKNIDIWSKRQIIGYYGHWYYGGILPDERLLPFLWGEWDNTMPLHKGGKDEIFVMWDSYWDIYLKDDYVFSNIESSDENFMKKVKTLEPLEDRTETWSASDDEFDYYDTTLFRVRIPNKRGTESGTGTSKREYYIYKKNHTSTSRENFPVGEGGTSKITYKGTWTEIKICEISSINKRVPQIDLQFHAIPYPDEAYDYNLKNPEAIVSINNWNVNRYMEVANILEI